LPIIAVEAPEGQRAVLQGQHCLSLQLRLQKANEQVILLYFHENGELLPILANQLAKKIIIPEACKGLIDAFDAFANSIFI